MDSIATLHQLDQECNSWANQHAHSCNLIASLINITRQRDQTLSQWQQQQQQHSSNKSSGLSTNSSRNKSLLASSTLQLLIHKQTLEIESVINQLYDTIQVFRKVLQSMIALERQVEASVQKMDTTKLLSTINYTDIQSSSTSILSGQPSKPVNTVMAQSKSVPKSSLMDTAEISPLEVLDWVSRVRSMYAQELNVKQAQIHPAMTVIDRYETLVDMQRSWGLQKNIDFALEQEIVERIKTYRRVREYASRV